MGSILLYFGALVAFGVYVLRVVVDLLVMEVEQRLSEAFRKLLTAIPEAKNLQQPLKIEGLLHALENDVFVHSSPSAPSLSSFWDQFWL